MATKTNTYTKRTKLAKDASAISVIAMNMAKKASDPNALKAGKFKSKFLDFKAKAIQKYKAKAKSEYMRKLSNSGNKNKK